MQPVQDASGKVVLVDLRTNTASLQNMTEILKQTIRHIDRRVRKPGERQPQ